MKIHAPLSTLALALCLGSAPALASPSASARFLAADGTEHGTATLTQTPSGVLIKAELSGLPPGEKGFHIHAKGECEPPFDSAGGHFNPDNRKHGLLAEGGPHAGDMPNIHTPASGELTVEVLNTFATLEADQPNSLNSGAGTALMIHVAHDDHSSDPSGDAGARLACAVIR